MSPLAQRLGVLWKWLKWPAALGILALLYWRNQSALSQIAQAPKSWGYLGAAVALIGGSTLLTFVRWLLLVRAQEIPFRLRDALRLGFIGLLSNYVAPGSVGGDIVKAFLLSRDHPERKTVAVATVFLDRILGLLALFLVGAAASLIPGTAPDDPKLRLCTILLWVGSLAGLLGVGLLLLPATTRWSWIRRLTGLRGIGGMLGELVRGVQLYQSRPIVLGQALALSVVGHAGLIGGFYCCALWMRQPWIPDLVTHFYFMPNAELFGVVVPAPGGVGPLEYAIETFYKLLRPVGVDEEQAAAAGLLAALAFRVVTVGIAAVGGAYYFTARREIAAALHDAGRAPASPAAGR